MNSIFAGAFRSSFRVVLLVGLWLPLVSVAAQDESRPSKNGSEVPRQQEGHNQIIARVNGHPIPRAAFLFLIEQSVEKGQTDDNKLQAAIKEKLIVEGVVAIEASRRGIGTLPDSQKVVSAADAQTYLAQQTTLIRAYLKEFIKDNPIGDDALKTEYYNIKYQVGGVQAPPFDEVKKNLTQRLQQQRIDKMISELRSRAIID